MNDFSSTNLERRQSLKAQIELVVDKNRSKLREVGSLPKQWVFL